MKPTHRAYFSAEAPRTCLHTWDDDVDVVASLPKNWRRLRGNIDDGAKVKKSDSVLFFSFFSPLTHTHAVKVLAVFFSRRRGLLACRQPRPNGQLEAPRYLGAKLEA